MTQNVRLTWNETGQGANQYVANFLVNGATDTTWNVALNSTNVNSNDRAVKPRFLTVDNIFNNVPVQATFGPFTYSTPAFQRQTYTLPDNTSSVQIILSQGITNIYLSEFNVNPDTNNSLLIQQTAVKTVIYGHISYNATVNQQQSDLNTYTDFKPVASDMQYNMLGVAGAPVSNGWFQYVTNLGTKNVSIIPNGGDTINNFYTNGQPLVLGPGDAGYLSSDGVNWFFHGKLTRVMNQPYSGSNSYVATHNFGIVPTRSCLYLRVIAAGTGYNIGERLLIASSGLQAYTGSVPANATPTVFWDSATQVGWAGTGLYLVVKAANAVFQVTGGIVTMDFVAELVWP